MIKKGFIESAGGVDVSETTAAPGDVLSPKKFIDQNGDLQTGSIVTKNDSGKVTLNLSNTVKDYPAGYYPNAHGAQQGIPAGSVIDSAGGSIETKSAGGNTTLDTSTISKSYPAGYYPNAHGAQIETEEKSATPSTSAQNITPTSGKVLSKVSVAAIPNQKSDSGNVSLAINGTKSYAAGYYPNAHGVTQNITTKGAETITPGTSDKSIASGQYLTGKQTIKGDANLVAGNILYGKSIFNVSGNVRKYYNLSSSKAVSSSKYAYNTYDGITAQCYKLSITLPTVTITHASADVLNNGYSAYTGLQKNHYYLADGGTTTNHGVVTGPLTDTNFTKSSTKIEIPMYARYTPSNDAAYFLGGYY